MLSINGNTASIVGAGTVTVTAVKAGDDDYLAATATQTFTVSPKNITEDMVGQIADQKYTGQQIKPAVEVKDGTTTLAANTDYTITYSNNINVCDKFATKAPTAAITGKGNYKGTVTRKFTINRAKAEVTIANSNITKIYGDDPFLLPGITKTGNGALTYTVKSGKDVISVSSNGSVTINKVGKAVIGVATEGTTEYEPADEKTINITILECTHTGGTAYCNKKALCEHCGEEYGEFDYTRHSGGTETRDVKAATCTEKGHTGNTYCKGCGNITKSGTEIAAKGHQWNLGEVIKEATASKDGQKRYTCTVCQATEIRTIPKTGIKVSQDTFILEGKNNLVYGDGAFTFTTTGGSGSGAVTYSVPNNKVLSITGNKAFIVGAGTVTVTAEKAEDDDYLSASARQTFTVSPKSLTNITIGQIADQQYTGQQIKPAVEVKDGTTSLILGTDYEIAYSNNIKVCDKSAANAPTATITGKGNYSGEVVRKFTIKRLKAAVTITEPTITKTYGDASFLLQGITKTGNGELAYRIKSGSDVISVSEDGMVSIHKVGSAVIGVTTKETTEYEAADEKTITITINKAQHAPLMPDSEMSVANTYKTVGEVPLPENWQWKDGTISLNIGQAVKATAIYKGDDAAYYNVTTVEISITRSDCNHTGGTAYCDEKAKCVHCGERYGTFDSTNHHGGTEKKDEKEATCTENGYTGDTYCKGCGIILESGKVENAKDHQWDSGTVIQEPTSTKDGVMLYTCTVCKETKNETIPKTGNRVEQTDFTIDSVSGLVYGDGYFTLTTSGGNGKGEVTYSVPDNKVLSITGNQALIMGAGSVTVTATKAGDDDYLPATATQTFTVEGKSLLRVMVGGIADQYYTGLPIEPDVLIKDGATVLEKDTDYTITYSNNIDVNNNRATKAPTATIAGKGNYTGTVIRKFTIQPGKAEVIIAQGKDVVTRTYGDKAFQLEGITKTGDGEFHYEVESGIDVISVSENDGIVTIQKAGTAQVSVTTTKTQNYQAADKKTISITIEKAEQAPLIPLSEMYVASTCKTVGNVVLTGQWTWRDADRRTSLKIGSEVKATAIYDGDDQGNYKVEEIEVSITRMDCVHETGDMAVMDEEACERDREATCTNTGYGHKECTKCGHIIEIYIEVPALGHTGGTANCSHKAVCERCREEYGDLDSTRHSEDLVKRNEKAATCTTDGYSGDLYCQYCDKKIETGTVITAEGHKWDAGKVTKEATATEDGVMTYTCSVCKETKTEAIPKNGDVGQDPPDNPNLLAKPEVGAIQTDPATKAKYKITSVTTNGDVVSGTVEYIGPIDKNIKTANIPSTIKVDGATFKVTSVAAKAFKGKTKLTKVTIGNNVISIGAEAFSGCKALKTVKLGSNVTTIGNKAFYKCVKLTKITIPAKVTKIGSQAFGGCKALKTITIKTTKLTAKNVGKNAFKGISAKAKVKVPKSKKKAYNTLLKKKGVGSKAKIS